MEIRKNDVSWTIWLKVIADNAERLCANDVDPGYIRRYSLPKADVILVNMIMPSPTQTRSKSISIKLNGFVIMQIKKDYIFIDVICASGVGKVLLSKVEKIARQRKKKYIVLNALPHVINFYKKLGFVHGEKVCQSPNNVREMEKPISSFKFKHVRDAMAHYRFVKFIKFLISKELTAIEDVNKKKKCNGLYACANEGFVMTKCIK